MNRVWQRALLTVSLAATACSSETSPGDTGQAGAPMGGASTISGGGESTGAAGSGGAPSVADAGTDLPSPDAGGTSDGAPPADVSPPDDARSEAASRDAGTSDGSGSPIPQPPPPGSLTKHPTTGAVAITSDDDARAFCSQYDGVIGSFTITSNTMTTLDALACIVEVTGAFQVAAYALESAVLPNLRAVGSLTIGSASKLARVELPVLQFCRSGDLRISGSDALLSLSFPALTYVRQSLAIVGNTKLTVLSAPLLVYAGGDISADDSQLAQASFPAVVEVGHDFSITSTALKQVELRALQRVGNTFGFSPGASFANVDLSQLESVMALALDGNGKPDDLALLDLSNLASAVTMSAQQHPQLKEIRAPKLGSLNVLSLSFNSALERASFPALTDTTAIFCSSLPVLSSADFSSLARGGSMDFTTGGPVDLTFPRLTTATEITTAGIRSFSAPLVPSLTSGSFDGAAAGGFHLSLLLLTRATSLKLGIGLTEVDVPLLKSADSLVVRGTELSAVAFGALDQAKIVYIDTSPKLATIRVPLVSKLDELIVASLPLLDSASFDALATVPKLTLSDLPAVRTLALPHLTQVVTMVEVRSTALVDLSGLSSLTYTGTLLIETNPSLRTALLPNLSSQSLGLTISGNASLATIGFPEVTGGDFFSISANQSLGAIGDFSKMTSVNDFFVLDHPALVDLQGLHAIRKVVGKFHITGNTILPQAEVDGLVQAIGRQNIAGEFVVQ